MTPTPGYWVSDEVQKWNTWIATVSDHEMIPWQMQIGKTLQYYDCDVEAAKMSIEHQVSEDAQQADKDDYWTNVRQRFYELYTNHIMMKVE